MTSASGESGAPAGADSPEAALDALRRWHDESMDQGTPLLQRVRLIAALNEVRAASLDPKDALESVMAADAAWRLISEAASRRYRRDPSSAMPDPAQFHGEMGEIGRLFGEIYAAFADLLAPGAGAEALDDAGPLPQVTAHALFHLGKRAKWLNCSRELPDAKLWRRLHQLILLAFRHGYATKPVVLFQAEGTIATCSQLWLRTVMLATLNTGALSPRQVDRAEEWLEDWCRHISADQNPEKSEHLYCVDVEGEAGPVRISPGLKMARPVYLRTTHLYSDIVSARPHFLEKTLTSSLGWYAKNPLREYLDLLDQLQQMWASAPSQVPRRSSERKDAPPDTPVDVVQGFAAILALCDPAAGSSVRPAQWTICDHSEGGLGMVCPLLAEPEPITQQVIAARWQDSAQWQIGVIVRIITLQRQKARLAGVRLLAREAVLLTLVEAPEARPGASRTAGTERPAAQARRSHQVFFLAGNERTGQADSLLCRPGTLVPNMKLRLDTDRNEFIIQINRLIEGAADWERIGFQVMEKRAIKALGTT